MKPIYICTHNIDMCKYTHTIIIIIFTIIKYYAGVCAVLPAAQVEVPGPSHAPCHGREAQTRAPAHKHGFNHFGGRACCFMFVGVEVGFAAGMEFEACAGELFYIPYAN